MPEFDVSQAEHSVFHKIEVALEQMLVGKPSDLIQPVEGALQLNRVVDLINMLSANIEEMAQFAREMGKGNLDVDVPGRRNYLAAPLKALHSQLTSFAWTAKQAQKGNVVNTLDYMGELSAALNGLIERVSGHEGAPSADEAEGNKSSQYHQMLSTLNRLPLMVIVTDAKQKVLFVNMPAIRRLGRLQQLDEGSGCLLEATLCAHSVAGTTYPTYTIVWDEEKNKWYRVSSDIVTTAKGEPLFLHSVEDISEWKINEKSLEHSAMRDPLTGVYNRAMGVRALEAALEKKDAVTSCVAFIDIDNLKHVNDTYGHTEGDYVIDTIAGAFSASVRDSDAVSRLGGDEFLILFSGCPIDAAERVIARVQDKINAINAANGKPFSLSFSYGIAQIDRECDLTAQQVINLTDKKMYEKKKAKKEKA